MGSILIRPNNKLAVEENNKILDKAVKLLRDNGIDCEGFSTIDESYYYNEILGIFSLLKGSYKDNEGMLNALNALDNDKGYRKLSEDMIRANYVLCYGEIITEVKDAISKFYYSLKYTDSILNNMTIKYNNDGKTVKYKDLDKLEQDIIRNKMIEFKIENKYTKVNYAVVDEDELGLHIDFK